MIQLLSDCSLIGDATDESDDTDDDLRGDSLTQKVNRKALWSVLIRGHEHQFQL